MVHLTYLQEAKIQKELLQDLRILYVEDAIWPYEGMSQDAIRLLVHGLRKKLPDGSVENVSGVGYRLNSYTAQFKASFKPSFHTLAHIKTKGHYLEITISHTTVYTHSLCQRTLCGCHFKHRPADQKSKGEQ